MTAQDAQKANEVVTTITNALGTIQEALEDYNKYLISELENERDKITAQG